MPEFNAWCKDNRNFKLDEIMITFKKKLIWHYNYFGIAYNDIDFLGFNHILTGSGKVIRKLRFSSKQRMRKHIKIIIRLKNKFIIDEHCINMRINSFKAHLKYSNEKCDKLLSNIK